MKQIFIIFSIICFVISKSQIKNDETSKSQDNFNSGDVPNLAENNFVDIKKGIADFSLRIGTEDLPLDIKYNSNKGKNYKKKLYSYNAGEIGEGFQYGRICKIIRDNGNTKNIDDDVFYFMYGEESLKLIPVKKETINNQTIYSFNTEKYSNWIFTFLLESDKWKIRKENGNQLIFGETSNSIEYTLFYKNWTGTSQAINESQQSIGWSLSREINVNNREITYEYLKKEVPNRINGLKSTESLLINKIKSDYGTLIFNYLPKNSNEIYEISTLYTEPDGYIERYSSFFLDNVELYNTSNLQVSKYQFTYLINQVNGESKRLLSDIKKSSPNSNLSIKEYSFQYNNDGLLEYFYNKYKGSVKFNYKKDFIKNIDFKILSPDPTKWNKPHFVVQDSYLVVFWENVNQLVGDTKIDYLVQVYNWSGKSWVLTNINTQFSSVYKLYLGAGAKVGETPSFQIISNENFFGFMFLETTLHSSTNTFDLKERLWLYNKNADGNTWNIFNDEKYIVKDLANINSISYFFPQLKNGKDFALLAAGRNFFDATFNVYNLVNHQWVKSTFAQENLRDTFYSTINNKILQHKYNSSGNGDVLNLYHKDTFNNWTNTSIQLNHPSDPTYPFKTTWNFINDTSALRLNETGYYIYTWDENYNIFEQSKISNQAINWSSKLESQGGRNTIKITDNIYNHILGHYNGNQWSLNTYAPSSTCVGCNPSSSLKAGENIYIQDYNLGNLFVYNPSTNNFTFKKSLGGGTFYISKNSLLSFNKPLANQNNGFRIFTRNFNSENIELKNSFTDKNYEVENFLGQDIFTLNYYTATDNIYFNKRIGTGTRIIYRGDDGEFYTKNFNKFRVLKSNLDYYDNKKITFINNSINTILVYEIDENAQNNVTRINNLLPNVIVHKKINNSLDEIEYNVVDNIEINSELINLVKSYYYINPTPIFDNSDLIFEQVSEKITNKGGINYLFDTGINDVRLFGLLKKTETSSETETLKSTTNNWSVFEYNCLTCPISFSPFKTNIVSKINMEFGISSNETFQYNEKGLLKNHRIIYNGGDELEKNYLYATDINNNHLINLNMIGIPLIIEIKKNGYLIEKSETKYNALTHLLPTSILKTDIQSQNYTDLLYDLYDNKGNLLQYTHKGKTITFIYGYNQTLPIAKLEGITYQDVMTALGLSPNTDVNIYLQSDIVKKSNLDIDDASEQNLLDAFETFRSNSLLKNIPITTYTYNPLVGLTSVTPPSGIRAIYHYNNDNKLDKIVNMGGKVLEEFNYNYKQ